MSEFLSLGDPEAVYDRAVEVLRAGGLVVLPTDTVYAVVGDAFNPRPTGRIFRARRRGRDKPLPVLIRSPRQVAGLVSEVPETADRLMAAYWPGPLTLMLPITEGLTWELGETAGAIGLRMPTDDLLLRVIAEVGPLACTGANRRGQPVPADIEQARQQLGTAIDLYVDGGERIATPSTVVDVTGGRVEVLRPGAIPAAHIEQVASGELAWGAQPSHELSDAEEAVAPPSISGAPPLSDTVPVNPQEDQ